MASLATVDPGTASPVAPSADLDLGGAFDSALETVESGGGEAPETGAEATPVTDTQAPPVGETEAVGDQAEPQVVDAQAQPVPGGEEWPLAPDGQAHLVPKDQIQTLKEARAFKEAVGQIFPDVESAQVANLQAHDFRVLFNDWASGTPQGIQGVLRHLAGANHSQLPHLQFRFQNAFAQMAKELPQVLREVAPQAHEQLAQDLVQSRIEAAYERAAQTGNPDDFLRAQHLDWGVTGQYRTELAKLDPAAVAQRQFEQQRKEFESRQQVAMERDSRAFDQSAVEGAKYNQLWSEIDKLLEPLKAKFPEKDFADKRTGIQRDVVEAIKRDQQFWLEHQQEYFLLMDDYKRLWQQGQPASSLQPRIQHFLSDFLSRAKRQLPAIVQSRFSTASAPQGAVAKTPPAQAQTPAPGSQARAANTPAARPLQNGPLSRDEGDKMFSDLFKQIRAQDAIRRGR